MNVTVATVPPSIPSIGARQTSFRLGNNASCTSYKLEIVLNAGRGRRGSGPRVDRGGHDAGYPETTPGSLRASNFWSAKILHTVKGAIPSSCQSALKFNPLSASNRDPSLALGQACPGSE